MTYRELLPGGEAAGMSPSDFDPASLREGTEVEMEHTTSRKVAREIAMDHLAEDPQYYVKLRAIHTHNPKKAKKKGPKAPHPGRSNGMTYDQIKKQLREASRLIDAGNVAGADKKIRSMLGKGLTVADLHANLTASEMKALRDHSKKAKKNPGTKYHHTQAYHRAIEGAQWLVKATKAKDVAMRFDSATQALLSAQAGLTEASGTTPGGIYTPKLEMELRRIRRESLALLRQTGNIPKQRSRA